MVLQEAVMCMWDIIKKDSQSMLQRTQCLININLGSNHWVSAQIHRFVLTQSEDLQWALP